MLTLTHEVNHLLEKHSGEEPDLDGIYYKSNSNFFSGGGLGGILGDIAAVALAPFTSGASLGYLPLASAAGGAIQSGIQGMNPLTGALKGAAFGGVGAGLGGAVLGGVEGAAAGGLAGAGSGALSGAETGLNTFVSGIPGFGAGGAANAATGLGGSSFGGASVLGNAGVGAGSSALESSVLAPGQAAANAAAASLPGTTFVAAPTSAGLLGTINAFNAGTASGTPAAIPGMSLANGGVGTVSGTPIVSGGTGVGTTGVSGTPQMSLLGNTPAPAGLPATTINPNTGLDATLNQQAIQPGAGITTADNLGQNLGGINSIAPLTTSAPAGSAAGGAANAVGKGFDFSKLLSGLTTGVGALGAGSALLGTSAAIPSPQFQMPASVGNLSNTIQRQINPTGNVPGMLDANGNPIPSAGGLTTVGKQGNLDLSKILTTPESTQNPALAPNDPYFASTFQTIDQNFQNAKQQLDAAYNQVGQLGSGEYMTQLNQLTQATANDKDQIVAQENQRRQELGQSQQFQAIQTSLGVDTQTMNDLAGITGIDVQTASLQYGVDATQVQDLRNMLGGVGTSLVNKGLGLNAAPTTSVNLLGVK